MIKTGKQVILEFNRQDPEAIDSKTLPQMIDDAIQEAARYTREICKSIELANKEIKNINTEMM